MSTEAAIQKGKGIVANPEFILTFGLSAFLGIGGVTSLICSWLDYSEEGVFEGINVLAVVLVVVLAGLMGAAVAVRNTSIGGEGLFVGLVALFGLCAGITAVLVLFLLWGSPSDAGWLGVEGFNKPLIGALIGVLLLILAPATIYGESILPIFIALIAGAAGVLSVITFVMVVFIGVD
ncbi:MAG: hypothetical protein H6719_24625 [Sandaracinaceae bacterium]|nr:hypothetical protein [Sandaracinaceae bacterium]